MKIILRGFLLSLLLSTVLFAQEAEKEAVLVDAFGKVNCEDVLLRIDNLMQTLRNKPNSTLFVVVYDDKNNPFQKYVYENYLKNVLKYRDIQNNRFTVVRGKEKQDSHVEFWISEISATPKVVERIWDYSLLLKSKPFMFANWDFSIYKTDTKQFELLQEDCGACCLSTFESDLKLLKDYLRENPSFKANLAIYPKSVNEAKIIERELKKVIGELDIPQNRLRFFHGETRGYSQVELWLVPPNSKRK